MQLSKSIMFVVLSVLASSQAMAVSVTEFFSYDGSYTPTDAAPPAGQTTWQQFTSMAGTITPNSPAPGLATFDDPDSGRISIFQQYADPAFIAAPANFEYEYSSRHQINSTAGAGTPIFIGARDEGGNGKVVMLGFNSNTGTLGFYNTNNILTQTINAGDFRDGRFHDYRVVKFIDPNDSLMKVSILIDGVPEGSPVLYSNDTVFPLDANNANGFGYYSPSTNHTSNVVLDQLSFGAVGGGGGYSRPSSPATTAPTPLTVRRLR